MTRTSTSDPLRIDEVSCAPFCGGVIGLTICPGKTTGSSVGEGWARNLSLDVAAINCWEARVVLTLIDLHEMHLLQVSNLGEALIASGIRWHHLPILDGEAPRDSFMRSWPETLAECLTALRGDRKVLVHCRGGQGRSGTVACMLLIELGLPCQEALRLVRQARRRAVDTRAQQRFLEDYAFSISDRTKGH